MADVPTINPSKPLWPTRRDGKNPANQQRDEDKDEGQPDKSPADIKHPDPKNDDGHIDEYV